MYINLYIIITINKICGAYSASEFKYSDQFYGTGETFVFSFYNEERIHSFNSTNINEFYIYSDNDLLAFGCSYIFFIITY